MRCGTARGLWIWLHRLRVSFRNWNVSKAPALLPELPTAGGSYVLSADGKQWTPANPALIEEPTDAANEESPDPGGR